MCCINPPLCSSRQIHISLKKKVMDRGVSKQSALQGSMGQNNDPGLNSSVFADSFVSWWMHLLHHLTQVLVSHSAAFPSRVSLFSLWVLNSSMYKLLDQFKWEDIFMHKTTGLTATPKCKIRNYSRASETLFPIMQCMRIFMTSVLN